MRERVRCYEWSQLLLAEKTTVKETNKNWKCIITIAIMDDKLIVNCLIKKILMMEFFWV